MARRSPSPTGGTTEPEPVFKGVPKFKKRKPVATWVPPTEHFDEQDGASCLPAVQKPNLKRRVLERSAQHVIKVKDLPHRDSGASVDRPSYSADYLSELKSSTPQTPSQLSLTEEAPTVTVDIASKFGEDALALSRDQYASPLQAHIPSEAEIREKKERRRRLAKEKDFISLNDDEGHDLQEDSNNEDEDPRTRSLIIPADEVDLKSKYGESRLVRDDEDIAEGFDDFVEDAGKVTLGRKAAKEQDKQRRKEMEEQIRAAQHGYGYGAGASESEDDEDDEADEEEVKRNVAYEAAQTQKGTYVIGGGVRKDHGNKEDRERRRLELPKTKPVPEFKVVVGRLAEMARLKEHDVEEKRNRLQRLGKEKEEIEKEEIRVKDLLREAGERFEKLRMEATTVNGDLASGAADQVTNGDSRTSAMDTFRAVGLSDTPGPVPAPDSSDDDAPGGLGSLNAPRGLGSSSGMAQMRKDDDDDWY